MKALPLLSLIALLLPLSAHAEYCREYTKNVKVGGRTQESYGTACMQQDGAWAIQPTQTEEIAPEPISHTYVIERERPATYVVKERQVVFPFFPVVVEQSRYIEVDRKHRGRKHGHHRGWDRWHDDDDRHYRRHGGHHRHGHRD